MTSFRETTFSEEKCKNDVLEKKQERRSNKQNLKVQTSHKAVMNKPQISHHIIRTPFLCLPFSSKSNFTKEYSGDKTRR